MDAVVATGAIDTLTRERAPAGARVQLTGIAKHYGAYRAIDDLDLDIRAGEFLTLLGPSGSGKTTTLMLIAGFERPTAGEIAIDHRPISRLPPYRRDIGMVFQSYALFPHMTVAENIAFPLRQRGVARAEREAAVTRMLDLVQLEGYGTRHPEQLSGGQQQRVAIARAVVFNPRVLLMDEPLSALDKQLRETLQLEIKRLHARLGITFVYVTHDQREALVMSDRVCVMNHGRIEQIASPRTLYDAPANRFVATFVGEANFSRITRLDRAADGTLSAQTEWGATIRAAPQPCGAEASCMIRPERINVAPAHTKPAYDNAIPVTVSEVVFMGEAVRYTLDTATGHTILARAPHRAAEPALAPGDRAIAGWTIADTRLVS